MGLIGSTCTALPRRSRSAARRCASASAAKRSSSRFRANSATASASRTAAAARSTSAFSASIAFSIATRSATSARTEGLPDSAPQVTACRFNQEKRLLSLQHLSRELRHLTSLQRLDFAGAALLMGWMTW